MSAGQGWQGRLAEALPAGVPGIAPRVHAALRPAFGPSPIDPARDAGDPGLFGPRSATWRVLAEPAAIVGGVRGLLVQLLHPQAMAGVADHSAFETDPLGRLARTAGYVATVGFGSLDQVVAVSRVVQRRHVPVTGTAPGGSPYAAGDPRLLAWVSLALTESFLAADAAYAPSPVTDAAADAFVAEQSRTAALLDPAVDLATFVTDPDARAALRAGRYPLPMIDNGSLPVDVAGLRDRVAEREPELGLGEQGRRAIGFLAAPPLPPSFAVAYRPILAGALATIPAGRRRRCGWPVDPRRDVRDRGRARAMLTFLRTLGGPLENHPRAVARLGHPAAPATA